MRIRQRNGQATLEFALAVPVLILIIMGILAFGQIFNHWLALNHAAREAVRGGATGATDAEVIAIIQKQAFMLNPTYLTWVLTPAEAGRVSGQPFQVELRYQDYISVPIVGIFVNPKQLYSRYAMRIERLPG